MLLFLHADTDLPEGALRRVGAAVAAGADVGCSRVRIDARDPRLRLASRLISLRSTLLVSGTGDQALFFRRAFFEALGGVDDLPLFEDMRIVGRARGRGRWVCLGPPVRTSARRWEAHGVARTMATMLALRGLYHLGVPPARLARLYRGNPREAHDARRGDGGARATDGQRAEVERGAARAAAAHRTREHRTAGAPSSGMGGRGWESTSR